jgi:hypothetical protein
MQNHFAAYQPLHPLVIPSSHPRQLQQHTSVSEDLTPWLQAAQSFMMNTDFDVSDAVRNLRLGFDKLMAVMKAESANKKTIQALGDKIVLSQMLDNLSVPQMPLLFSVQQELDKSEIESFVTSLECSSEDDAFDLVIKPTHLSNCDGTLLFSKDKWEEKEMNAKKLYKHMKHFLNQKAADCESEALQSVTPGFIVQPRYRSCVEFKCPLEMRVVTLWGKAHIGVWWWGRRDANPDPESKKKPQRTTWLVRRPKVMGKLSSNDDWELLHEHAGQNRGFEKALELFKQEMPRMAAAAEAIAAEVGAPFLRSDFFVGSEKWGVRLNEVAYGSGCDVKRRAAGAPFLIDDGPLIAQILQEGFKVCRQRAAPEHFLSKLGVQGSTYEELEVGEVPEEQRHVLQMPTPQRFRSMSLVPAADCETPQARASCQPPKHQEQAAFHMMHPAVLQMPPVQLLPVGHAHQPAVRRQAGCYGLPSSNGVMRYQGA